MREILSEIDNILSRATVSGENVIIIAVARQKLKDLYDSVKEEEIERS